LRLRLLCDPGSIGSFSWLLQVIAALSGAMAIGLLAWFLIKVRLSKSSPLIIEQVGKVVPRLHTGWIGARGSPQSCFGFDGAAACPKHVAEN